MDVLEFVNKWRRSELREKQGSQSHFNDVCDLVGHPKPAEVDPRGEWFCFERGVRRTDGDKGWADVWKRGHFGWEYKGLHKNLDAAYGQLLRYRDLLENPPLLVVSDMDRIIIRTNFTNTASATYEMNLETIVEPRNLEVLRWLFHDPEKLRPGVTSQAITEEAARHIGELAQRLRARGEDAQRVAHFLNRIVFCMFAEDIGLLPINWFTKIVQNFRTKPEMFARALAELFDKMATGGISGVEEIRHFNGHLFDSAAVLELDYYEIKHIYAATELDWSAVDPSIFGTLFERGLDPEKRGQLGAHYTGRADIETVIEPVVMTPLRREWDSIRTQVENLLETGDRDGRGDRAPTGARLGRARAEGERLIHNFLLRLESVKVLDPACGSGNFLYVALQKLKDLEKEAILFANDRLKIPAIPVVGPRQLFGIEINPYAHDLAQMTVWIGYLQWTHFNGFQIAENPVLDPLDNIVLKDAIIDLSDPENPREPDWPVVDYIIGNPPFLGDKLMRGALGDDYVDRLRALYADRLPGGIDLCCYWFERARAQIAAHACSRAGLLATQGIRGNSNRKVLDRIKKDGDIFFAVSDRDWVLDGASVHISIVAFDNGVEESRVLDGRAVPFIAADLTGDVDVTRAVSLRGSQDLSFFGSCKGGAFDLSESEAIELLHTGGNPNGRPNSDLVRPVVNGQELANYREKRWIIDTANLTLGEASGYEAPFRIIETLVKPSRDENRDRWLRENWWRPQRYRPAMRKAVSELPRFLVTTATGKHRHYSWLAQPELPDHQLIVVASDREEIFGVLNSTAHSTWVFRKGTQTRERESGFRYTTESCFHTFPFPTLDNSTRERIAEAARDLDAMREAWLNPPEWVREEVLEFPGSTSGPWARFVVDADERGIGTVRYGRLAPRDADCAAKLSARTLTNLYNERPTWLALAHERLDAAVAEAYGWGPDLSESEILERLLALNLAQAAREE